MANYTSVHFDTMLKTTSLSVDGWSLMVTGGSGPVVPPPGAFDITGSLGQIRSIRAWLTTASPTRPAPGAGFRPELEDEVIIGYSVSTPIAIDLAFNAADAGWVAYDAHPKPGTGLRFGAIHIQFRKAGPGPLFIDALAYPLFADAAEVGQGAVRTSLF